MKVEPENDFIKEKLKWALEQRSKLLPTIPSTMKEEMKYNVFLRYDSSELLKTLHLDEKMTKGKVLEKIRRFKDTGKIC